MCGAWRGRGLLRGERSGLELLHKLVAVLIADQSRKKTDQVHLGAVLRHVQRALTSGHGQSLPAVRIEVQPGRVQLVELGVDQQLQSLGVAQYFVQQILDEVHARQ